MHMRDSIASYFRYISVHFKDILTIGDIFILLLTDQKDKKGSQRRKVSLKPLKPNVANPIDISAYLFGTTQTYLCNVD